MEVNKAVNELKNNREIQQARFGVVKSAVVTKCLTVEQFGLLLEQFDDESHKVELAKYSIPYLYDRDNYNDLRGIFKSPRNMQKVTDYIESRRID